MTPGSDKHRMTLATILKYFGMTMVAVYLAVGIAILFRVANFFNVPSQYSAPIGLCLIGYGVFRGYRLYQKYTKHHHESDN